MTKRTIKQKLIALEHSISVTENRLRSSNEKLSRLSARLDQLRSEHLKLRLSSGAVLGPHTRRNQRLYLVWDAIRKMFDDAREGEGLSQRKLYEGVRAEGYRLKEVTFRSYMRRYRIKGLVKKVDERWYRVFPRIPDAHVQTDGDINVL